VDGGTATQVSRRFGGPQLSDIGWLGPLLSRAGHAWVRSGAGAQKNASAPPRRGPF